jgi:hypothetical protein
MTATSDDRETELHSAGLDGQNRTALGRLLGTGKVGHAEEGSDGVMRATVRIPEDELMWEPSILVFPHGGTIELTLINWMVNHSKGTATLELGGPGTYYYGSTTGNDEGRGLTGALVLGGEVPDSAKIDRPPQPRP